MCLEMVLMGTYPVSCSEEKEGERTEAGAREKERGRRFGMCAHKKAIREELSLFSHENYDFSLIF